MVGGNSSYRAVYPAEIRVITENPGNTHYRLEIPPGRPTPKELILSSTMLALMTNVRDKHGRLIEEGRETGGDVTSIETRLRVK